MIEGVGQAAEVTGVLSGMGLPGAIIGVLMTATLSLVSTIVYMQKRADKIYGYRLSERDTLKDALHESSQAIIEQSLATQSRNAVTEDLASAISAQTQALSLLTERITIQHSHLIGDHDKVAQVVTAIAEAMRNAALQSSGVKQSVDQLLIGVPGISKEIREHIKELLDEIRDNSNRRVR